MINQEERTLYNEEIFGMSKFIQFANKNAKSLTANLLLKLGIISHNQKYYDNTPEKNEIIPNSPKSCGNPNSFHYSSELNTSQQNAEQIDRANFFQYQKIGYLIYPLPNPLPIREKVLSNNPLVPWEKGSLVTYTFSNLTQ